VAILDPLTDLVAWVIMHIHTALGAVFGPNTGLAWGLSIALVVILIRLLLVPLFVKQVHAQRKMAQHAPQLQELRKKYKNDKTRLNEETMKFYKENGVNPLAGCLPMIPQMIVFFSLFYVLRGIAEWQGAHYVKGVLVPAQVPKYGLTTAVVESAQKATIFGVHLGDKLLFPHTASLGLRGSIVVAVSVAISASTTFMTVRQSAKRGLMQTNVDPDNPMAQSQKYMMYIVPFFSLTGLYWQYGLVLYWVTTNLWTLGQQFFMFRNWEPPVPVMASAASAAARAPQGSRVSTGTRASAAGGAARTASGAGAAKTAAAKTTAAGTAARTTAGGTAKTTAGGTAARTTAGTAAKTTAGGTAKTTAATAAKPASAGARAGTGTRDGRRSGASATQANGTSGSGGAATSDTGSGRVRTGNASRDAAANSPGPVNGQNGAAKRSLLRLGRSKPEPEPEPEPEGPAAKVVRQQPVRQARSKRSGKR
jgi:YidC/Oxa1 family membrane protein insertase